MKCENVVMYVVKMPSVTLYTFSFMPEWYIDDAVGSDLWS